jgi:hypothetical protein
MPALLKKRSDGLECIPTEDYLMPDRLSSGFLSYWQVREVYQGKLSGIRYRQASQADRIEQLEDGGIRPDAAGERNHRDGAECWTFPQLPQRIAKILCKAGHLGFILLPPISLGQYERSDTSASVR